MTRALALALVAALAAAGCMPIGQDFLRPDEGSVRLGETTLEEVRSRYGAPRNERSWGRSDAPLAAEVGAPFGAARVSGLMRELYYYHENRMGEAAVAGVEPSKSVRFWFFDERLVGYLAHSSFRGDSTGFDEAKAATIVPWRTRRGPRSNWSRNMSSPFVFSPRSRKSMSSRRWTER